MLNYGLAAARAGEVKFSPIQYALLVEDVRFVAGQLGNIFIHLETSEAYRAFSADFKHFQRHQAALAFELLDHQLRYFL